MKSEVKESEVKNKYPCLMEGEKGAIFLLTEQQTGICVHQGAGSDEIGAFSDCWLEHKFKPFTGTVTLSN